MLAREVIDWILNKYKKIRTHPLSQDELVKTRRNISSLLPAGYNLLEHSSAEQYGIKLINGIIMVTMTSVVINKGTFKIFNIIPVPNLHNGSIMVTNHATIAVSQNQGFFYPLEEMPRLNDTHFIIEQP